VRRKRIFYIFKPMSSRDLGDRWYDATQQSHLQLQACAERGGRHELLNQLVGKILHGRRSLMDGNVGLT
jgi:hypothetical protein